MFLSKVSIEERKRESSSPANFEVLPEKCIKRLQQIAKAHCRGIFEALDELRIEREVPLAIDSYLQLELANGKIQSLTPGIFKRIANRKCVLSPHKLGFYFPNLNTIMRQKDQKSFYLKRYAYETT